MVVTVLVVLGQWWQLHQAREELKEAKEQLDFQQENCWRMTNQLIGVAHDRHETWKREHELRLEGK